MKIYTKGGDTGKTGLWGGTRVSKAHARIEAYGSVDELNSVTGSLKDGLENEGLPENILSRIQHNLFVVGSILAADPGKNNLNIPGLPVSALQQLEHRIDQMEEGLPQLKAFVLPGGHPLASQAHICRTVCRRAERAVVVLAEGEEVPAEVLVYLNRLSDYFFVLSRHILNAKGLPDVEWHPAS